MASTDRMVRAELHPRLANALLRFAMQAYKKYQRLWVNCLQAY